MSLKANRRFLGNFINLEGGSDPKVEIMPPEGLKEPLIMFSSFPPSSNALYPASGGHRHLSKKAAKYKTDVQWQFKRRFPKFEMVPKGVPFSKLFAILDLYPPDNRERDVDNFSKLLIDSFIGLIYEDDSQVKKLLIEMHEVEAPGSAIITFGLLDDFQQYLEKAKDITEVQL